MLVKDAQDDARIRHTCDLDIFQIIINTEAFFECAYERMDTRAAGVDQRAVDVEKQKAFLRFSHTNNDEIRMTSDEGMTKVK
jgi:hypothetical protein